ncbi:hypothetical protein GCM10023068_22120 [Leifsonia shinshuensis]
MGATLALEASAYCNLHQIDPVPRCVLVYMALRSLDDASGAAERPARRSYLSRAQLGLAIGRFMPDREPPPDAPLEQRRQWDADNKAIVRALRTLKAAHAIREVASARPGRTVEFEICLGRGADAQRHPSGDAHRPPRGTLTVPETDAHRPPKENEEKSGEVGGRNSAGRAPHFQPVDNSDERKSA